MVLGTVFIIKYPINKKRLEEIVTVLELRRAGQPYGLNDDAKKLF